MTDETIEDVIERVRENIYEGFSQPVTQMGDDAFRLADEIKRLTWERGLLAEALNKIINLGKSMRHDSTHEIEIAMEALDKLEAGKVQDD